MNRSCFEKGALELPLLGTIKRLELNSAVRDIICNRIYQIMSILYVQSFMKNLLITSLFILIAASCDLVGSNNEEGCLIQSGIASWYGEDYHGSQTANGEIYDMESMTAAHKRLPFNTVVGVKNLDNGENVIVRINNRGPYVEGRVIDLSRKAAREIGILTVGLADVELYLIKKGEGEIPDDLKCQ